MCGRASTSPFVSASASSMRTGMPSLFSFSKIRAFSRCASAVYPRAVFQDFRPGRDAVAEYVQRVRRGGGELYAAEAADALALAGLHKDRQPRRSVVVRKREQREAALFSRRGELLRVYLPSEKRL